MRSELGWIAVIVLALSFVAPARGAAQIDDADDEQVVDDEQVDEPQTAGLEGRSIGPFVGINVDASDPIIGADARWTFDMPEIAPWLALAVNPSFSYQFVDSPAGASAQGVQIDVNGLAKFGLNDMITPYAGIGIAITVVRFSPDVGDASTETDTNVNLLVGGARFEVNQPFEAFAQARITNRTVGSDLSLMGGILFDF